MFGHFGGTSKLALTNLSCLSFVLWTRKSRPWVVHLIHYAQTEGWADKQGMNTVHSNARKAVRNIVD